MEQGNQAVSMTKLSLLASMVCALVSGGRYWIGEGFGAFFMGAFSGVMLGFFCWIFALLSGALVGMLVPGQKGANYLLGAFLIGAPVLAWFFTGAVSKKWF